MTIRSFWTVLIKILAIYIILESTVTIPQLFYAFYFFSLSVKETGVPTPLVLETVFTLIIIAVYVLVIRYFLFKTDWIIDKLKLDQNFEEERFELNIHRSTILKIAVIIVGALLLVDSFPYLCKSAFAYFNTENVYKSIKDNPQTAYVVLYLFKTLIGYFMLTDSGIIVNFIERKRQKANLSDHDLN